MQTPILIAAQQVRSAAEASLEALKKTNSLPVGFPETEVFEALLLPVQNESFFSHENVVAVRFCLNAVARANESFATDSQSSHLHVQRELLRFYLLLNEWKRLIEASGTNSSESNLRHAYLTPVAAIATLVPSLLSRIDKLEKELFIYKEIAISKQYSVSLLRFGDVNLSIGNLLSSSVALKNEIKNNRVDLAWVETLLRDVREAVSRIGFAVKSLSSTPGERENAAALSGIKQAAEKVRSGTELVTTFLYRNLFDKVTVHDQEKIQNVGVEFADIKAVWCPVMVVVPGGASQMGSRAREPGRYDNEGPLRKIEIRRRFAVSKYPVTFEQFDAFCEYTGRRKPSDVDFGRDKIPVVNVSWYDARSYVGWLSRVTSKRYRLLSEAEWEYSCRSGTTTPFHTGAAVGPTGANLDFREVENVGESAYLGRPSASGKYPPNKWGLCDMHGNVWEWCEDRWHRNYIGAPSDGSAWCENGLNYRIVRGGSWYNVPRDARSANRHRNDPSFKSYSLGFRIARECR